MAKKYNCEVNGIPYFRKTATINGKRRNFYGDGEKDADRKIAEARKKCANIISQSANVTFQEGLEQWLYGTKIYTVKKPGTMLRYDSIYRHIGKTILDNKNVGMITRQDAELFVVKMIENGCSVSRIKETIKLIKMYFNYLVESEIIMRNPFSKLKLPQEQPSEKKMPDNPKEMQIFSFIEVDDVASSKEAAIEFSPHAAKEKRIEVFTAEEEQAIIRISRNTVNGFLLELDFSSGMRLGEICALNYNDFHDGGVWVTKNYQRLGVVNPDQTRERKSLILEPKSSSGSRFIPLSDEILTRLEQHRREQLKRLGFITTRVFTTESGRYLEKSNLYRMYKRVLKRAGVPERKFHTIRHTFITNCIESGMDIVSVQNIAGHSNISQTMEYTHIRDEHKKAEITKFHEYRNQKHNVEKNQCAKDVLNQ